MYKIYFLLLFIGGCLNLTAQQPPVNNGMWTWVNGDRLINQSGLYGKKNVANVSNKPGSKQGSVSWKDNEGNLWMFGGESGRADLYNDLWKYYPDKNIWVWINGDTIPGDIGIYGQKGIAATTNRPGARKNAVTWTDASGTFWLFGGFGFAAEGVAGSLNDLWKYTPADGWIWMSGDKQTNVHGLYGTKNVAATSNKPGSRQAPVSWTDASNNLWLHGGSGYGRDSTGTLNDLWKYNTKDNVWIWISGTPLVNQVGIYGTKGNAATTNMPGSRYYGLSWADKQGNLWLFGGYGYSARENGYLNDTWRFDPNKQQWTWVGGDNIQNQLPVYGTLGVTSAAGKPGGRAGAVSWLDSDNNFWLLGGSGLDVNGETGLLNDFWKYDFLKGYWTWISGDKRISVTGIYGTEGVAAAGNKPGGRDFSVSWTRNGNELWLFGGSGFASQGNGLLNDLWRFNPIRLLSCPSSRTLQNDTFCAVKVYNIDPVLASTATGVTYTFTGATAATGAGSASGLTFNTGSTTVVYKLATDTNTTCAFAVDVEDHTAPVPVKDTLPVITGDCSVTVTDRPKAKDNCAGIISGTTNDSLTYNKQGTYTIKWTYNDGHNNITTQQQQLVVKAGSGTLTPLAASLPDIVAECAVTITDIPLASKNCAGIFAATTTDPLIYTKQGTYMVNWIFNDQNGSIIKQQQRVIIKDTSRPVPQKDTLPDFSGACSATITGRPLANDNCAGTVAAVTADPLAYNKQGIYTITWIFNDGNGNSSSQQQRVIVTPGNEPIVPLTASLPALTGECSVNVVNRPQATGSCGHIITAGTADPLVYSQQGQHTITWTYTDINGNTASQQQNVTIADHTMPVPVLSSLPDVNGQCSVTVTDRPMATDNCAGNIVATTKDALTYTKQGTHVITWVYNDGNGNVQTQTQKVIIKNPVTLLPRFLVLPNITGDCEVIIKDPPTIQDYCLGTIAGSTTDSLTYSKPGTYNIYWKYITSSDDTVIQKQSVIVRNLALTINAFPNPASNYFTVTVKTCRRDEKISLRVFDVLGRLTEERVVQPYQAITLGNHYAAAPYFLQVIQGKERTTQKLIKVQ